jgi:hypothetical protein
MANLILPSRRIIQPQDAATIDWTNPITSSLAYAINGSSLRNNVDHISVDSASTATINVGVGGKDIICTENTTNAYFSNSKLTTSNGAGTGDFTLFCVAKLAAASGTVDNIIGNKNDNAGSPYSQGFLGAHTNTSGSYSANEIALFTYGAGTASVSIAAAVDASTYQTIIGVRKEDVLTLYVDSSETSATLAIRQITQSGTRFIIGNSGKSTNEDAGAFSMRMGYAWNRALDLSEIESLKRYPWQIFAPQKRVIYFDVGASAGYTLTTDPTSYSVSGQTSSLLRNSLLVGDLSTFSLNGQTATLTYTASSNAYVLTSSVGSFIFTGASASLLRDGLIYGGPNSFNLIGQTAALLKDSVISGENTPFTLSGQTIPLLKGSMVIGEAPAFIFNGNDAPLFANRVITAVPSNYALTGQLATLLYTQAGAYILPADGATFTYSGQAANTLLNRILTSSLGSFTVSGIPASLLRGLGLSAGVNNYILSGQSATLTYIGGYTLVCGSSSYTLSAQQAQLILNRALSASPSGYSIIGRDINFVKGIAESVGSSHIWNIIIKSPDSSILVKGLDNNILIK